MGVAAAPPLGAIIVLHPRKEPAMAISIRLPDEIQVRLERLAKRTGRSKTFYVTEAILDHLEDLEDAYLAERELAAIRAGRSTTTPLADVMKRYGMES